LHNEAPQYFIDFKLSAETFSQQKIAILHIDNAPELVKGKLESFCREQRIIYEKIVLDTPNQNSVAEHYNLTLASKSCVMILMFS
jgi:hypothetical protein